MDDVSLNDDSESVRESEKEEEPLVEEEDVPVDPRTLLTKEQVDYFREIFDSIDVDRKGKIPSKTMGYILRYIGLNPTKEAVKECVRKVDPNNKGIVDFNTFLLHIAERLDEEPETHEDIIAAFKILDEEGLDYLTTDQLYDFLTNYGEELEDYEIESLLKMAETKGTGRINYVEFVEKIFGVVKPKEPKKGKKGK